VFSSFRRKEEGCSDKREGRKKREEKKNISRKKDLGSKGNHQLHALIFQNLIQIAQGLSLSDVIYAQYVFNLLFHPGRKTCWIIFFSIISSHVCLTCRSRGLDFLFFFFSGEANPLFACMFHRAAKSFLALT
jgi:hypothetical protein